MGARRFAVAVWVGCLVGLPGTVRADDGDDTLRSYLSKSDVAVLGEFTSEPVAEVREAGVIHYGAPFKITQLLKGKPLGDQRVGGTIKANMVRFGTDPEDRPPELKKGGRCVLFLKCNDRQEPPSYITADPWFGVQPPLPSLVKSLARLAAPPAAPKAGEKPGPAAADPVRGKYVAYWLTRDPPDPNGTEYGPDLLLTRVPLPELADYDPLFREAAKRKPEDRPPLLDSIALTFQTYQKDSIWNPDGQPLKLIRSVGPVRAAAREVTINGTKYKYEDCPIPDVVRLLERPKGKKPLNRIYGPLTGAENTGRALMLLLKEQLAAGPK